MKILNIIILALILSVPAVTHAYNIVNSEDFKLKENKNGILLSLGGGISYYETSFVFSPGILIELHKNFQILNGLDFYTNSESFGESISINLIPYLILNISDKSKLKIGIGGAYFRRAVLPIFSTRIDTEIKTNLLIGAELKSLIAVGTEKYSFPVLLINFSFVL